MAIWNKRKNYLKPPHFHFKILLTYWFFVVCHFVIQFNMFFWTAVNVG